MDNCVASIGPPQVVSGLSLTTRNINPSVLSSRFVSSFEQSVEQLRQLNRMFIELDGSFVWRGQWAQHSPQPWQLDGMLYDCAGHLQRVELKGDAPLLVWEQLLSVFGWPQQPLLAHLVDQQCWLDIPQLLRAITTP